jgi:hypothetical protein
MPAHLITALESLSAYRHIYPAGDRNVSKNPVAWSHLKMNVAGRLYHVLSRIADFGLDYSQRGNKLAHHVALDVSEHTADGPAWLMEQSGNMQTDWDGQPRMLPAGRNVRTAEQPAAVCTAWQNMTGDAGWAGVLAESFLQNPDRPVYIVFAPGMDLLPLISEAIGLLPVDRQWDVTFNTYFTSLPPGVTCAWRCVVSGSPEADQSRKFAKSLHVNLCEQLPPATGGALVLAARTGHPVERTTAPPHFASADADWTDDELAVELKLSPVENSGPADSDAGAEARFPQHVPTAAGGTAYGVGRSPAVPQPPPPPVPGRKKRRTLADLNAAEAARRPKWIRWVIVSLVFVLVGLIAAVLAIPKSREWLGMQGDRLNEQVKALVHSAGSGPSARVDEVKYEFPKYMQLENRNTQERNIGGWEGTTVTVAATTNVPVKSATIVLCDVADTKAKLAEYEMQVAEGTKLSATWKLEFPKEGTAPAYYHIDVKTLKDETDPMPTQYTLCIRPDQRPEVSLLTPTSDLDMPADGIVPLEIQASDPDFKLQSITLKAGRNGKAFLDQKLFSGDLGKTIHENHAFRLEPLRLKAGETIQFWIEAEDNKQPTANRANTPHVNIRIGNPVSDETRKQELAKEKKKQEVLDRADEANNADKVDATPQFAGEDLEIVTKTNDYELFAISVQDATNNGKTLRVPIKDANLSEWNLHSPAGQSGVKFRPADGKKHVTIATEQGTGVTQTPVLTVEQKSDGDNWDFQFVERDKGWDIFQWCLLSVRARDQRLRLVTLQKNDLEWTPRNFVGFSLALPLGQQKNVASLPTILLSSVTIRLLEDEQPLCFLHSPGAGDGDSLAGKLPEAFAKKILFGERDREFKLNVTRNDGQIKIKASPIGSALDKLFDNGMDLRLTEVLSRYTPYPPSNPLPVDRKRLKTELGAGRADEQPSPVWDSWKMAVENGLKNLKQDIKNAESAQTPNEQALNQLRKVQEALKQTQTDLKSLESARAVFQDFKEGLRTAKLVQLSLHYKFELSFPHSKIGEAFVRQVPIYLEFRDPSP